MMTGWWFGTFFIFPYIGNNHPNWRIFFRGVQTTNQMKVAVLLLFLDIPKSERSSVWRWNDGSWCTRRKTARRGSIIQLSGSQYWNLWKSVVWTLRIRCCNPWWFPTSAECCGYVINLRPSLLRSPGEFRVQEARQSCSLDMLFCYGLTIEIIECLPNLQAFWRLVR